jgi:signal peptidase I
MDNKKTNKSVDGFIVRQTNETVSLHAPVQSANSIINPEIILDKKMVKRDRSGLRDLLSTLGIFVTAAIFAFAMVTYVFRTYQVDGPSMQTSLMNEDKLIIWKAPRTLASITGHPYTPNRGDVIVFTESGLGQFGQNDTKQLIKRVIGLPGDRVVLKDNIYTIYNAAHPNGFDPDKTLPYGKVIPATTGEIDITLSKTQLFVSGDNRPDSLDSRIFGPIDASQIVGKLVVRIFPFNQAKLF